jgi:hypothetical protein
MTDALSKLNAFKTLKCGFVFHVMFTPFAVEAEIRALVGQLWMHPHCSR